MKKESISNDLQRENVLDSVSFRTIKKLDFLCTEKFLYLKNSDGSRKLMNGIEFLEYLIEVFKRNVNARTETFTLQFIIPKSRRSKIEEFIRIFWLPVMDRTGLYNYRISDYVPDEDCVLSGEYIRCEYDFRVYMDDFSTSDFEFSVNYIYILIQQAMQNYSKEC